MTQSDFGCESVIPYHLLNLFPYSRRLQSKINRYSYLNNNNANLLSFSLRSPLKLDSRSSLVTSLKPMPQTTTIYSIYDSLLNQILLCDLGISNVKL